MTDNGVQYLLLLIAIALLLTFAALALVGIVALVGIRAWRRATTKRRQRNRAAVRSHIVAVMVEDDDDATDAEAQLLGLRGHRVETAILAMLPKVHGDAQHRLVAILRARGTERRAVAQTESRRSFVRCEGAFALGVLRSGDAVDRLIALLDDRSALVRRVAVRSLGQIGDARAVESVLVLANREPGLTRDLLFALREIGPAGAPALRAAVSGALERWRAEDRSGPLAASALGMIQDVGASAVLAEALRRGPIALQLAAAQALGNLDSPVGLEPLQTALRAPSNQLRVAAAASLGRLGAAVAIPALVGTMHAGDPATARAAAAALVELGPSGVEALERSGAPYAIEALALLRLRGAA